MLFKYTKPQVLPVPNPLEPYWRTDRHPLDEVRTTPDLPSECDIAIIGSGMAGITTAYHLLKDNPQPPRIVILEARQLCSGATGRNGGHSKIKTPTLANIIAKRGGKGADELQRYVLEVMDGLKQIIDEEELDCEFEIRSSFDIQTGLGESQRLKQIYDNSREAGHNWTKNNSFLDQRYAEQVTSIKGAVSAFRSPAISLWPYKFVTQLLARLLDRHPKHLNVQTLTPVKSATSYVDGASIIATDRGDIICSKVIFATNAWTSGLLPEFTDVIIPYRGMATHIIPDTPVHPHLTQTYNIDYDAGKGVDYLNPRPDGGIVVGGGKWLYSHDRKSWFNNFDDSTRFPEHVEDYWNGYMQRNFLGWEKSGAKVDKIWVGIMGLTPDEAPHVGRVLGTKSQWMLAGFNGGGMPLILTASKAVAKMVREDLEFETVAKELGIPEYFGTSLERMKKAGDDCEMMLRK